jgi:hypothetical protein
MNNTVKIFLLMLCLIIARQSVAYYVDFGAGASALPVDFAVDDRESELLTCAEGAGRFMIYNGTSAVLDWGIGNGTDTVPADVDGQVPPSTGMELGGFVNFDGKDAVFVRARGGSAITSGYVIMLCPGHN